MSIVQNVGSPRNRVDGPLKVSGAATYAAEFDAPDLAFGVVVSGAIAKGRIHRIDDKAARAAPGVLKIYTHENRPRTAWFSSSYQDQVAPPGAPFRPLNDAAIVYSGQPVALVVAESFEAARDAASLLRIEYDASPHITNLEASRPDAYIPPQEAFRHSLAAQSARRRAGRLRCGARESGRRISLRDRASQSHGAPCDHRRRRRGWQIHRSRQDAGRDEFAGLRHKRVRLVAKGRARVRALRRGRVRLWDCGRSISCFWR